MTGLVRIIIVGGIAILAFDAIAAAAAGALGVNYTTFAFGSYAIYAGAGFAAGLVGPLWWGAVAGGGIAAVEGIAGWRLAAVVGPDIVRLGLDEARAERPWSLLLLAIIAVGAILGLLGAGYARWRRRRSSPTPA